jgi:hypothetical protein
MFKKYFLILFSFFLLVLFWFNYFLRKESPRSYGKMLDYHQLYDDKDRMRIEELGVSGDSLDIRFAGPNLDRGANQFQIFSSGRLLYQLVTPGKKIRIKLDSPGIRQISIAINGSPDRIALNIDYSPDSVYRSYHNSSHNLYEITGESAVRPGRLYGAGDWAIRIPDGDPESSGAQSILMDSIHLASSDSSRIKIQKIARFILFRTAGMEGVPSDSIWGFPPLKQLDYIRAGKSRAWCGNFTSIFSYLATKAGMQVRWVSCGLSGAGYSTGIHVFCEVFLKEEKNWAYVDLTSRNILVRYGQKWLNVIDIQRLLRYPVEDPALVALHYEKDSLYEVPFFKEARLATYYFHPNALFTFYFGDYLQIKEPASLMTRGLKWFYPKPYYAFYSDNLPPSNPDLQLRILSNYVLAAGMIVWMIALVRKIF